MEAQKPFWAHYKAYVARTKKPLGYIEWLEQASKLFD